jgi:aspartate beta-hydroxylase
MPTMNRVTKLLDHLPELLRRDANHEPPLFPAADPLQYPRFLLPELPSQPWHEATDHPWLRDFENNHAALRDELNEFLSQQETTFRNYIGPLNGDRVDAGDWHILYLDYRGRRWDEHCKYFPKLMKIVDTVPRQAGTVFVSRLTPGTHIPPHCGSTNAQLTSHFGLVVPPGVEMRVGHETRAQVEGKGLVFDDSFEHEVWNRSDKPRYNVFIQFWHPGLSADEIEAIRGIESHPHIQGVISKYLVGASALEPVRN